MPCLFPFTIDNPAFPVYSRERQIPVPCGKCPACCERRASGWIFRLMQQDKVSESASFVTLTYKTKYVPMSKRGFMTLPPKASTKDAPCPINFQAFMKRLRKWHKNKTLRYYAVGEYGSERMRPHFHAIIFNLDREYVERAWSDPKTGEPLGDVFIGEVTGASVAYTTKYMSKGKLIPVHANDDRLPEYSLMSKKLGINYLTPDIIRYHQADLTRNYITLEGGHKIALPRYFREKIYTEEQRRDQGPLIKEIAEKQAAEREREYVTRTGDADSYVAKEFEARAAILTSYRKQHAEKRNKI